MLYFMHHKISISFILKAVFTAFLFIIWGIFTSCIIDSRKQTGSYGGGREGEW